MKRACLAVLLCALCLGLGACSRGEVFVPEPDPLVLTLWMEAEAGETARGAAGLFAEKAAEVSGGRVRVELIQPQGGAPALDSLLSGESDLFLVTNGTAAQGLGDYACFTSPYYFRDYAHMSLALNSDRLGSVLNARTSAAIGVLPIAALYNGSRVFVHAVPTFTLSGTADFVEHPPTLLPTPNGIFEAVLRYGDIPAESDSAEGIVYDFERRRVQLFDFYKRDFNRLIYHEAFGTVYLVDDFHIADINWLMLSAETAQALDDYQMAVLREAAAYALAWNDTVLLEWEQQMLDAFTDRFGELAVLSQTALSEEIPTMLRASGLYDSLWSRETYDAVRALAS